MGRLLASSSVKLNQSTEWLVILIKKTNTKVSNLFVVINWDFISSYSATVYFPLFSSLFLLIFYFCFVHVPPSLNSILTAQLKF